MATFRSQNNFEFPIPEGQFFRTGGLSTDFLYQRTPNGIKAYSLRRNPLLGADQPGNSYLTSEQFNALPEFSRGIVEDLHRTLGGTRNIQAEPFDSNILSQLGQITPLGNVAQNSLDAATLSRLSPEQRTNLSAFNFNPTYVGLNKTPVLSATAGQPDVAPIYTDTSKNVNPLYLQPGETPEQYRIRVANLQGYKPIPFVPSSTSPITSSLLNPSSSSSLATSYKTPAPAPIPSIAGLEPATITALLTGPEKQESSLLNQIMEIQNRLIGKSAFKTEQEKAAGVSENQQALDDLNTRLRDLQRQATAGTLAIQGQAIPTGIISGQQQAFLRNNAIEALTVSALIDATTNKLTSAQRKVDQAVAAKYDPEIERMNALIANAEIIKNSQEYHAADRERAELVMSIKEAQKNQLEAQKSEQKVIWDLSIKLAENGVTDTKLLEQVRNSESKEIAFQLAAPHLAKRDTTNAFDLITKAGDELRKYKATDNFDIISGAYTRFNSAAGTGRTIQDFEKFRGDDAAAAAMLAAYMRVVRPDVARVGDSNEGILKSEAIVDVIGTSVRKFLKDQKNLPKKLLDLANNADNIYRGSKADFQRARKDVSRKLGVPLDSLPDISSVTTEGTDKVYKGYKLPGK